jgi:nucleoside-diphosphate-sugar epimerase
MKILVTGSSGHLGEALVRTLRDTRDVSGLDIQPSDFTNNLGSILDREFVRRSMKDIKIVLHTATLHKPHILSRTRQEYIDTNITGTLNLLEEAVSAGVRAFIFTSTTSVFGNAIKPNSDDPALWVTEDVVPIPKNIYGVTKIAAEDLCELFRRDHGLACLILRTSRFFPEEDDREDVRQNYDDVNIKVNEFLYRRVDLEDVVSAHLLAMQQAASIGFGRYTISATTPFTIDDRKDLRMNAPHVVKQKFPDYEDVYAQFGWKMFSSIDRVYVNEKVRNDLGWNPKYDFRFILDRLKAGEDPRSVIARTVGSKGYHKS